MSDPEVSVIIPVYNRAGVIGRAVESVLDQTYTSYELIVVDDHSTDATIQQLGNYADARMRVLEQPENRGANAARNRGLDAARGRWIAFLDSDDRWYEHKLERQVQQMNDTPEDVGIVHCAFWSMDGLFRKYKPQGTPHTLEGNLSSELLRHNCLGFINTLIRRSVFEKTGPLNEDLPALQDWDFHLAASTHTRYAFLREPLLEKFPQDSSISRDYTAYADAHRRIYDRHRQRFHDDPEGHANIHFRTGSSLCLSGSPGTGRRRIAEAIELTPTSLKFRMAYVITYGGPWLFAFCWSVHSHLRAAIDLLHHLVSGISSGSDRL
jgi:glycosyltransferase involved in cell wall biosynthesis